uniref:Uncharacterized protein n=1 Tax=Vespula pensylvanica TaxID=30213 RepID=A0A834UFF2_VESPE|nr:hypothetical protein H0235_003768 [Vespula pensylvanica]
MIKKEVEQKRCQSRDELFFYEMEDAIGSKGWSRVVVLEGMLEKIKDGGVGKGMACATDSGPQEKRKKKRRKKK